MYIKTLTVSALNNYIKKVIDSDFILNNACVKGEISNFKLHSSGHIYFSLKDEESKINCIMFRSNAEKIRFIPEDGMSIIAKGRVSVYQRDGLYQLYCEEIETAGEGELYIAFQKLKEKLEKEGIFNEAHKKTIPKYAKKIGVITSPTGAAVRDIINVTKRRNKSTELIIYPSLVQGAGASEDIIKGISLLNKKESIDVIIIARGGGSLEELWAFNNEKLAYAIYNSRIPIITGIGHETDFTIADFVSDRRAPTPSAAAEIAVFNLDIIKNDVKNNNKALQYRINSIIREKYNKVDMMKKNIHSVSPEIFIVNQYNHIDSIKNILNIRVENIISVNKERLQKLNSLLNAHNPLNNLERGYSIIQNDDGDIVYKVNMLKDCHRVKIRLSDGIVVSSLKIIEESHKI